METEIPEFPVRIWHVLLTLKGTEVLLKNLCNYSHVTLVEHYDTSTDLILNLC